MPIDYTPQINHINIVYSKGIIKDIIEEYKCMKSQFLIITEDQIIEHISKCLVQKYGHSKN